MVGQMKINITFIIVDYGIRLPLQGYKYKKVYHMAPTRLIKDIVNRMPFPMGQALQ